MNRKSWIIAANAFTLIFAWLLPSGSRLAAILISLCIVNAVIVGVIRVVGGSNESREKNESRDKKSTLLQVAWVVAIVAVIYWLLEPAIRGH